MVKSATGTTRAGDVYAKVRADILGGRLLPGRRLKFPDLCTRYSTSVGAAREALTRLVAEGLVTNRSHQGFAVTALSYEELEDLTTARLHIEPTVLELSIRDGDMEWEAGLVAAHHLLSRAPFFGPNSNDHPSAAWTSAHAAYHTALLASCGNRRLLEYALALREEAELYRQWSVAYGQEPDRDIAGEHRALLEAAVDRKPELAMKRLREHIAHTSRLLLNGALDEPTTC